MTPKIRKLKRPSYFRPGTVRYKTSGHKVIESGTYYRCSKDSNQMCPYGEKQVRKDTLEKSFSRLATKLYDPLFPGKYVIEQLLRTYFWDLVFGVEERQAGKDELLNSTIVVSQEEAERYGRVRKDTQNDFARATQVDAVADYPVMLFAHAISLVQLVAADLTPTERGRSLAVYAKRVWLDDNGKIHSIELERWAWYVVCAVLERHKSGTIKQFQNIGVSNQPDELHEYDLVQAALRYGEKDFKDALGESANFTHTWIKLIKESFSLLTVDPKDAQKHLPILFQKIRNDLPLQAVMRSLGGYG